MLKLSFSMFHKNFYNNLNTKCSLAFSMNTWKYQKAKQSMAESELRSQDPFIMKSVKEMNFEPEKEISQKLKPK